VKKTIVIAASLMAAAVGCQEKNAAPSWAERLVTLRQDKEQFARQLKTCHTENEQLKKQLQRLARLPSDVKFENLNCVQTVEIGRYTGFYDKDNDDRKEKLIVYIQPIDPTGDIVKAAGSVQVQLWDLNKKAANALLGQWRVEPEELKKLWFATLLTINYRLTFDVEALIEQIEEPVTVKIAFTDYLTGKVFTDQKPVAP